MLILYSAARLSFRKLNFADAELRAEMALRNERVNGDIGEDETRDNAFEEEEEDKEKDEVGGQVTTEEDAE